MLSVGIRKCETVEWWGEDGDRMDRYCGDGVQFLYQNGCSEICSVCIALRTVSQNVIIALLLVFYSGLVWPTDYRMLLWCKKCKDYVVIIVIDIKPHRLYCLQTENEFTASCAFDSSLVNPLGIPVS